MSAVKICGLKDAAAVEAALQGGARYLGFVFFPKSPRHIAPEAAASLAGRARGRAEIVAVTVDADDELAVHISKVLKPDYFQAHGQESPARLSTLRNLSAKGVIRAMAIAKQADLAEAARFEPNTDMFLFDAKPPPGAELPGGNGAAFDWPILKGVRLKRPWFLSGGLHPENVAEAITAAGADHVDVSSGVESAPGLKDPTRIAAFLAAARAGPRL